MGLVSFQNCLTESFHQDPHERLLDKFSVETQYEYART